MPSNIEPTTPARFSDVEALEDFMSQPSPELEADLRSVDGDIIVLGAGGKMGPTLCILAKRAAPGKRVVAVARFTEAGLEERLRRAGVETIRCDLLDPASVEALPKLRNVIFMAGRKFGTNGAEAVTWAFNTYMPALVAQAFKDSRIVALSTPCIYPYVSVLHQGALEEEVPAPLGEYGSSALGRERMFEYFCNRNNTPGRLIRLSYAIDMRYGVLHDLARMVLQEQEINLANGHFNVIWQGDANAQILRALRHCTSPLTALNVSGPELGSVRALATEFGKLLGRTPRFKGVEEGTAWVVNTTKAARLFGNPRVTLGMLVDWTADWVVREMPRLDHDTHFSLRDGVY